MWVAYLKIDIVELSVKGLKSNAVGLRWKDGRGQFAFSCLDDDPR